MTGPEHYNPVLVTVLPRERRARHPYQLAAMVALILTAASQLIVGAQPRAAINELPAGQQEVLNWFCLLAGLLGIFVAIVPERIVRWRQSRAGFDATWVRLFVELGTHGVLASIWLSYFVTVAQRVPPQHGLSMTTSLVLCLAGAAGWRCIQILWTVLAAVVRPPEPTVIIGSDEAGGGG